MNVDYKWLIIGVVLAMFVVPYIMSMVGAKRKSA